MLLALFPGVAGLISVYGLFADPGKIAGYLDTLAGILPEGGMQILSEQIKTLTAQPPQKLGLALLVSLGISLWSANGGIKSMFDALNVVYREKETRSFIGLNLQSLTFTIAGWRLLSSRWRSLRWSPICLTLGGFPAPGSC